MRLPEALVLSALAFGCQSRVPEPPQSAPAPEGSTVAAATHSAAVPVAAVAAPAASSGKAVTALVKDDVTVGKGTAAKTGDSVRVHYTGTLLDGTKFDSSLDRSEPFEFTLGAGMVIKGWDDGIVGMKPGGKRKLTIPSDLAYGKSGRPPVIPPDSPLVFDVELLEVSTPKAP